MGPPAVYHSTTLGYSCDLIRHMLLRGHESDGGGGGTRQADTDNTHCSRTGQEQETGKKGDIICIESGVNETVMVGGGAGGGRERLPGIAVETDAPAAGLA